MRGESVFSLAPATRVGCVTPSATARLLHLRSSPCLHLDLSSVLYTTTLDMETIDIARLKSGEVNLGVCLAV